MKMKKIFSGFATVFFVFGVTSLSVAAIIDFTGGTAYLMGGSSAITTNTGLWDSTVDYYVEDGVLVDFVGGYGTIGDYYSKTASGGLGGYGDSVIHAHDFSSFDIVFSKVDGSVFDLNYVEMTSNTENGGGLSTGRELSYITNNLGDSFLLAPSDWGIAYSYEGLASDGIIRNWMDSDFNNISSFTISSDNAHCFGMDNFYIDEEAPSRTPVPEPATLLLLGMGITGLVGIRRKKKE
ncbi:PEP-CTERM protein-sorting domain-containing protein [Candidatus Electrothrix aarhusensis]|uniref:PEP-CTERM protein-sorting domain-containing protein n=1 Tax=Candidatus Electrothrix aarhusensis TaxID=1859131 RepID=A0A3S3SHP2_9BACT|nr:PEP-CTERM protein-sorting domain-containing protein [Candidatus Electrothrix aarhusensis]